MGFMIQLFWKSFLPINGTFTTLQLQMSLNFEDLAKSDLVDPCRVSKCAFLNCRINVLITQAVKVEKWRKEGRLLVLKWYKPCNSITQNSILPNWKFELSGLLITWGWQCMMIIKKASKYEKIFLGEEYCLIQIY